MSVVRLSDDLNNSDVWSELKLYIQSNTPDVATKVFDQVFVKAIKPETNVVALFTGCPLKATGVEPSNLVECTKGQPRSHLARASLASSTLSSRQDLNSKIASISESLRGLHSLWHCHFLHNLGILSDFLVSVQSTLGTFSEGSQEISSATTHSPLSLMGMGLSLTTTGW